MQVIIQTWQNTLVRKLSNVNFFKQSCQFNKLIKTQEVTELRKYR